MEHKTDLIKRIITYLSNEFHSDIQGDQEEGIKKAKIKGTYKGRVKGAVVTNEKFYKKYELLILDLKSDNVLSYEKLGKIHDLTRQTVSKVKARLIKLGDIPPKNKSPLI